MHALPFFPQLVSAGFPSPADEYAGHSINLNTELIAQPLATYCIRAQGNSMELAGILEGDLLIVDRALTPVAGDIVIACVHGDFLVKRLHKKNHRLFLQAESDSVQFEPLLVENETQLWGVVIHSITTHRYQGNTSADRLRTR